MNGLNAITTLQAQLTSFRKQSGALNVSAIQLQPQVCNFCGEHTSGDCQVGKFMLEMNKPTSSIISNAQQLLLQSGLEQSPKSRMG